MKFAVLSDTHFIMLENAKDSVFWNRVLLTKSAEIARCLVKTISEISPDFVVICGDITHKCNMENFRFACEIFNSFPCPWYAVPGNHDTWYPGVRQSLCDIYKLPDGKCYYSKRFGDLYFIFMDMCYWKSLDGSISPYLDKEAYDSGKIVAMCVSDEEMEWIESELEVARDCKVVMVGHVPLAWKPLYPVARFPDGKIGQKKGEKLDGFLLGLSNGNELKKLISKYDNVKLVLSGHWHINDLYFENGIAYCQTGSLREYPFELRVFDYNDGILSANTISIGCEELRKESYIEEWGNKWIEGEGISRNFRILL
ncbi:MAG: metallophosphoesterase [Firmicutes bacterium]|nr:metallophosphoesterase [Bacillota bacterium]